ncbi:MAG: hypothetical protein QGI13_01995 [Rhodospirillales bacterium]|jgi:hypothetical protein|nr:hypothetical protein [Rhodospirillales bacterium]
MSFPGAILMGAQTRLLDPTIPYRYFAAALMFHILLWALIAAFPVSVAYFAGGYGPALAALHSLTLGVLAAAAMGAAFQMLPVATGTPLRSTNAARAASWFFIPGTGVLIWGMALGDHPAMVLGGFGVALGLGLFAVLVAEVLWRARAFESLSRFGLTALAALVVAVALGLALIMDGEHGFLVERSHTAALHLIVGGFGFMGLLALGFSHVLVPLFALAEGVPTGESRAVFALCTLGLMVGVAGVYQGLSVVAAGGALCGFLGVALHLRGMARCLATGMRKNLGVSALLMRASWGFLVTSLIVGLAVAIGFFEKQGLHLFVFLVFFGWLLTFLLGVLQRIMPFLGSMNASRAGVKPPRPSELAPKGMLYVHAVLHALALALVGAGIGLEAALPVRLGGIAGLLGALIYASFGLRIWWLIHGRPPVTNENERP